MALYCDTPAQSVAVAVVAGLLAGSVGLVTGSLVLVLLVAATASVVGEVLAHEYAGDDQYRAAKRRLVYRLRSAL